MIAFNTAIAPEINLRRELLALGPHLFVEYLRPKPIG